MSDIAVFGALAVLAFSPSLPAEISQEIPHTETKPNPKAGALTSEEIKDFQKNSLPVQQLLLSALLLSTKQLDYRMGGADPALGGMDCSGTIYYLLRAAGISKVPRQSDQQYRWTWEADTFTAVNARSVKTYELTRLRPGDLLFWTGTYEVGDRDPAVSHVMIYLGSRISDGKALMFGASNGRYFEGHARWGVGVFDFTLPSTTSSSRLIGYATIPGLNGPDLLEKSVPAEKISP